MDDQSGPTEASFLCWVGAQAALFSHMISTLASDTTFRTERESLFAMDRTVIKCVRSFFIHSLLDN